MLKTLFITGFIVIPLVLAFVLIAYRARFFILGVAAITLLLMLLWGGLKLAVWWDERNISNEMAVHANARGAAFSCDLTEPGAVWPSSS